MARRRAKRNADARQARLRKKVRLQTIEAWGRRCACGGELCSETDWRRLQVHEEPPRSRGGDPLDPLDCVPLSAECHARRTGEIGRGRTLWIDILQPTRRCRGMLRLRVVDPNGLERLIYVEPAARTEDTES